MNINDKISYVEFPSKDLEATKAFFSAAFGWSFEDFGSEYCSFSDQGVDGGFFKSAAAPATESAGPLVVLYSVSLEEAQARVERAGGSILKPIFAFPGGRRFHFLEPGGNELAVWSDVSA